MKRKRDMPTFGHTTDAGNYFREKLQHLPTTNALHYVDRPTEEWLRLWYANYLLKEREDGRNVRS